MSYLRKQEVVEAMRWTGKDELGLVEFLGIDRSKLNTSMNVAAVHTGSKVVSVNPGWWIVKPKQGDLEVYSDAVFLENFELGDRSEKSNGDVSSAAGALEIDLGKAKMLNMALMRKVLDLAGVTKSIPDTPANREALKDLL